MNDHLLSMDYSDLPKPTKVEIEVAIEKLSERYHRAFTYEDASRFITLSKALKMWKEIDKDIEEGGQIDKKHAKMVQKYFKKDGKKISLEMAYIEAEKGLITHITLEMLKITDELKVLTEGYK